MLEKACIPRLTGASILQNSGFSVSLEVFQKLVPTSSATLDFVWWKCINVTNEGYAPGLMSFSVAAGVWAFLCVCILTMGFPLWQVISQPASLVWLSVQLCSFFLVIGGLDVLQFTRLLGTPPYTFLIYVSFFILRSNGYTLLFMIWGSWGCL